MSKLGYDETNFTNAIVDLGKCENENKYLNRQILELKEEIKDLNASKLRLENRIRYGGKKYKKNKTKRIKNKKNKTRRLKCKNV
jgi:hypothetical protein